jgi:hypothetical protein
MCGLSDGSGGTTTPSSVPRPRRRRSRSGPPATETLRSLIRAPGVRTSWRICCVGRCIGAMTAVTRPSLDRRCRARRLALVHQPEGCCRLVTCGRGAPGGGISTYRRMAPRILVVRWPRLTSRSRRPVAPGETRRVRRQRDRGMRLTNVIATPFPETLSCAREQPLRSTMVRRIVLGEDGRPLFATGGVNGVVGAAGCCGASPAGGGVAQFGGMPI